jgi:hypothetical protein
MTVPDGTPPHRVGDLLTGLAEELGALPARFERGERAVATGLAAGSLSHAQSVALQDMDRIAQTLSALSTVLGRTAARIDPDLTIDAGRMLASVPLAALGDRLRAATLDGADGADGADARSDEACAPCGEVDLF